MNNKFFQKTILSAISVAFAAGVFGCAADVGDPEATGTTSQALSNVQQSQQDAHHIWRYLYTGGAVNSIPSTCTALLSDLNQLIPAITSWTNEGTTSIEGQVAVTYLATLSGSPNWTQLSGDIGSCFPNDQYLGSFTVIQARADQWLMDPGPVTLNAGQSTNGTGQSAAGVDAYGNAGTAWQWSTTCRTNGAPYGNSGNGFVGGEPSSSVAMTSGSTTNQTINGTFCLANQVKSL